MIGASRRQEKLQVRVAASRRAGRHIRSTIRRGLTPFEGCDSLPRKCDPWSIDRVMCPECPLRRTCAATCEYVERELPSMEAGRVDPEDLERIYHGRIMTQAILDNVEILSERQQRIVQLYYRENLQQTEIAEILSISQQAVGDAIQRTK